MEIKSPKVHLQLTISTIVLKGKCQSGKRKFGVSNIFSLKKWSDIGQNRPKKVLYKKIKNSLLLTPWLTGFNVSELKLLKAKKYNCIMGESRNPEIISTSWFEGKLFNLVQLFIIKMELLKSFSYNRL